MKSIIVLSDTHRNISAIDKLDTLFRESDYILHLGDNVQDAIYIKNKYGEKVLFVAGNCDFENAPKENVLEIDGVRIFYTHGDLYGVKHTTQKLLERAKELNCQMALYGHTHCSEIAFRQGVTLLNPGNLTRYETEKSIGYIVVTNGKTVATINKNISQ